VVKDGAQRVIRFAKGKSTKRSQVDAEHLTAALRQRGVAQLAESETDELWLIADPSDLRKPYASEMPDLMRVKDLDGKLVPGYRTLNVLGMTPGRRGILYHRLFSSVAEDFDSEPLEVQRGLKEVSQAVQPLKERMAVSWIVDRGFDDVAVWRTIWEQEEHVVCRVFHTERLAEYQTADGKWEQGDLVAAQQHLRPMASAQAEMVVRRGRQKKEKQQRITAEIRSCPLRLTYDTHVRREGDGQEVQKGIWLIEVEVLRSTPKINYLHGGRLDFHSDGTAGQLLQPADQIIDFCLFLALVEVVATQFLIRLTIGQDMPDTDDHRMGNRADGALLAPPRC
jgi:hypothetical protein